MFNPMLASTYNPDFATFPAVVEPKLDGIRAIAECRPDGVRFFTRAGKEIVTLQHIARDIYSSMDHVVRFEETVYLDGEIVSGTFTQTVSAVMRKTGIAEKATFHLFDMVTADAGQTQAQRRSTLVDIYNDYLADIDGVSLVGSFKVSGPDALARAYKGVIGAGGEGVIVKDPLSTYTNGRSHDWLKIKAVHTYDLTVTGAVEGTGINAGTLGVLVATLDGVTVRVSSGLARIGWAPDSASKYTGRTIEVAAQGKTPKGSLRHPRFIAFRGDK